MLQLLRMPSALSLRLWGDTAALPGVSAGCCPPAALAHSAVSFRHGEPWLGTKGKFMPNNHANLSLRSRRAVPAQGTRSGSQNTPYPPAGQFPA